jgi:hypothetical protein
VEPVAIEIADHPVERNATLDVPMAHDLEAAKESDVVLGRNHLDDF